MKKFIFFFSVVCFFLTTPQLWSQNLPTQLDRLVPEKSQNKEEATSTYNLDDIKKYQPSITPINSKTNVENVAVVRFASHAKVAIILHEKIEENLLFLKDAKTGEILRGRLSGMEIIFSRVQLDHDYLLIEQEEGKDALQLGSVSTHSKQDVMAILSDKFYYKLSNYSMNPQNAALRSFLFTIDECSYLERLAFYQAHILKGEAVDDKLIEGDFPETNLSDGDSPEMACICTYITKATRNLYPGRPVNSNNLNSNDNIFTDYSDGWIQEGSTHRAYSNSGPAKWQQLASSGEYESGGMSWTNGGAESASPFYASLSYTLFCTNYTAQVPSGCECNKSLPITAKYITKLNVATNTDGCFFCWGDRNAIATVEDWAAVVQHNVRTGEVRPVAVGGASLKSGCSTSVNVDFFVKLLQFAGQIVGKLAADDVQYSGPNGGISTLATIYSNHQKSQFINNVTTGFVTLIQTPIVNRTPCGSEEITTTLVDKTYLDIIMPNSPMVYSLFSASHLTSSGATRWSSNARVISAFSLGAVLLAGVNGVGSEYCCSSSVASWISCTTHDLPSIRPSLESSINNSWYDPGRVSVNTDFGYKQGILAPGCIPLLEGVARKSDISVTQLASGVYLDDKKGETLDCTISDILGRVVGRYKGEAVNSKVWDFTSNIDAANSASIYILKVNRKNGVSKTFKIIKK